MKVLGRLVSAILTEPFCVQPVTGLPKLSPNAGADANPTSAVAPRYSSLSLTFGLGSHEGPVDIEVRWPSGLVETFEDQVVRQTVTLTEGRGVAHEAD